MPGRLSSALREGPAGSRGCDKITTVAFPLEITYYVVYPARRAPKFLVAAGVRKWREFPSATLPSPATAKSLISLDLVRK